MPSPTLEDEIVPYPGRREEEEEVAFALALPREADVKFGVEYPLRTGVRRSTLPISGRNNLTTFTSGSHLEKTKSAFWGNMVVKSRDV